MICPCCSAKSFAKCCEPLLLGTRPASNSEALMRSRYSAFCLKNMDYIEATFHPSSRKSFDRASNTQWAEAARFEGLRILKSSENGIWYFVEGVVS